MSASEQSDREGRQTRSRTAAFSSAAEDTENEKTAGLHGSEDESGEEEIYYRRSTGRLETSPKSTASEAPGCREMVNDTQTAGLSASHEGESRPARPQTLGTSPQSAVDATNSRQQKQDPSTPSSASETRYMLASPQPSQAVLQSSDALPSTERSWPITRSESHESVGEFLKRVPKALTIYKPSSQPQASTLGIASSQPAPTLMGASPPAATNVIIRPPSILHAIPQSVNLIHSQGSHTQSTLATRSQLLVRPQAAELAQKQSKPVWTETLQYLDDRVRRGYVIDAEGRQHECHEELATSRTAGEPAQCDLQVYTTARVERSEPPTRPFVPPVHNRRMVLPKPRREPDEPRGGGDSKDSKSYAVSKTVTGVSAASSKRAQPVLYLQAPTTGVFTHSVTEYERQRSRRTATHSSAESTDDSEQEAGNGFARRPLSARTTGYAGKREQATNVAAVTWDTKPSYTESDYYEADAYNRAKPAEDAEPRLSDIRSLIPDDEESREERFRLLLGERPLTQAGDATDGYTSCEGVSDTNPHSTYRCARTNSTDRVLYSDCDKRERYAATPRTWVINNENVVPTVKSSRSATSAHTQRSVQATRQRHSAGDSQGYSDYEQASRPRCSKEADRQHQHGHTYAKIRRTEDYSDGSLPALISPQTTHQVYSASHVGLDSSSCHHRTKPNLQNVLVNQDVPCQHRRAEQKSQNVLVNRDVLCQHPRAEPNLQNVLVNQDVSSHHRWTTPEVKNISASPSATHCMRPTSLVLNHRASQYKPAPTGPSTVSKLRLEPGLQAEMLAAYRRVRASDSNTSPHRAVDAPAKRGAVVTYPQEWLDQLTSEPAFHKSTNKAVRAAAGALSYQLHKSKYGSESEEERDSSTASRQHTNRHSASPNRQAAAAGAPEDDSDGSSDRRKKAKSKKTSNQPLPDSNKHAKSKPKKNTTSIRGPNDAFSDSSGSSSISSSDSSSEEEQSVIVAHVSRGRRGSNLKPPRFSGSNFAVFKTQFETACEANGYGEIEKRNHLRCSLEGTAATLLGSTGQASWTYAETMAQLEARHGQTKCVQEVQNALVQLRKRSDQTAHQFADEVNAVAAQAALKPKEMESWTYTAYFTGLQDEPALQSYVRKRDREKTMVSAAKWAARWERDECSTSRPVTRASASDWAMINAQRVQYSQGPVSVAAPMTNNDVLVAGAWSNIDLHIKEQVAESQDGLLKKIKNVKDQVSGVSTHIDELSSDHARLKGTVSDATQQTRAAVRAQVGAALAEKTDNNTQRPEQQQRGGYQGNGQNGPRDQGQFGGGNRGNRNGGSRGRGRNPRGGRGPPPQRYNEDQHYYDQPRGPPNQGQNRGMIQDSRNLNPQAPHFQPHYQQPPPPQYQNYQQQVQQPFQPQQAAVPRPLASPSVQQQQQTGAMSQGQPQSQRPNSQASPRQGLAGGDLD